jgi:hypothetical protein
MLVRTCFKPAFFFRGKTAVLLPIQNAQRSSWLKKKIPGMTHRGTGVYFLGSFLVNDVKYQDSFGITFGSLLFHVIEFCIFLLKPLLNLVAIETTVNLCL